MKIFKDKVAVVTGAGSGIGRALAIEFSALQAKVAINDVNAESLRETEELVRQNGGEVMGVVADISKEEQVEDMASKIVEHYGKVDILINNAGVTIARFDVDAMPTRWWHWLNDINLHGTFYCTKYLLPHIRQSERGHIVNISSAYGIAGVYGRSAYCASKFGLRGFSESLHLELLDSKIGVTLAYPGSIKTKIAEHSQAWENPQEKENARIVQSRSSKILPAQAARMIIRGIRKNKVRVLMGAEVKALDFMVRFFPSLAPRLIHYFLKRAERTS